MSPLPSPVNIDILGEANVVVELSDAPLILEKSVKVRRGKVKTGRTVSTSRVLPCP